MLNKDCWPIISFCSPKISQEGEDIYLALFATLPLLTLTPPSVQPGHQRDVHKRLCCRMQRLQHNNQPLLWLQLCYWCEQSHFHCNESRCWILSDRLLLQSLLLHAHLLRSLTHHDHGQGGQWHSTLTNSQFKVGNLLVHIRCVDEDDKALGMAIQVTGRTSYRPKSCE